uniref:Uncharacterized protein n=1 Tax=Glossina palpalis gambiensis TaxID=67801 RepID=A0A1B0B7D9_9MUSC
MRCLNYCVKEGTPVYCGKRGRVILYWTAFQGFLVMLVRCVSLGSSSETISMHFHVCLLEINYKVETFNNNVSLHASYVYSIPYAIFYVC